MKTTPTKTPNGTTPRSAKNSKTRAPWHVQALLVAAVWGVVLVGIATHYAVNSTWTRRVLQSSCAAISSAPVDKPPRLSSVLLHAAINSTVGGGQSPYTRVVNPAMGIYPKYVELLQRTIHCVYSKSMDRKRRDWGVMDVSHERVHPCHHIHVITSMPSSTGVASGGM